MARNADNNSSNCRDAYGTSNGQNASRNKTSNASGQDTTGTNRNAQETTGSNSNGQNASRNKTSNASGQNKSGSNSY